MLLWNILYVKVNFCTLSFYRNRCILLLQRKTIQLRFAAYKCMVFFLKNWHWLHESKMLNRINITIIVFNFSYVKGICVHYSKLCFLANMSLLKLFQSGQCIFHFTKHLQHPSIFEPCVQIKSLIGLIHAISVHEWFETNPFPNLSLFYRAMLFEYPSVLSRFCL